MFIRLVFAIAGFILLAAFSSSSSRWKHRTKHVPPGVPEATITAHEALRPDPPAVIPVPERETLARHHPTPQRATGPPTAIDETRPALSRGNTATRQVLDLVCTACSIENVQSSSRQVLDLDCTQPFSG